MATIRTTYKYKVDLDKGTFEITLRNALMQSDALADAFEITVQRNGQDVDISTMNVYGYLYASATKTTALLKGTISGNKATVVLTEECYAVPGYASLAIQLHDGDVRHTVLKVDFVVTRTGGNIVLDGGNVLPTLAELLNKISAMEQATSAANTAATTANEAAASVEEFKGEIQSDIDTLTEGMDSSFEFEITSKNLYNGISEAGYLLEDGTLTINGDWRTTDYIYVHGQESIVSSFVQIGYSSRDNAIMYGMTTYGENKNPIEYVSDYTQAVSVYAPASDVYYIRFCYHADTYTDVMVEPGTERTSTYEPYTAVRLVKDSDYMRSGKKDVGYDDLENSLAGAFVENWTAIPLEFTVEDEMFNSATGEFLTYEGIDHTDYLDCTSIKKIRVTGTSYFQAVLCVFFDAAKNVVSHFPADGTGGVVELANVVVSIPENAAYMVAVTTEERTQVATTIEQLNGYAPNVQTTPPKWADKKWPCIGDSLTERNSRTTKNYHDYVSEATGITVVNMGVSGSGYARKADSGNAFYQRIVNVPTDADVVTIFGSGNDLGAGLELGTPTDTGTETLCGCINTTIDNLISIMPTVSLGIVSPTPWVGQPPSDTDCAMALYSNALKTICEYRSIPFLDLYRCSNLRPWTEEGRAACYTKDDGNGVHPDETGHKLIAARFKAFLETLIM